MNCKICNNSSSFIFSKEVLKKYDVKYYQCSNCGFIQTEEPYWIEEAYNSALNTDDTGILQRNFDFQKKTSVLNYFLFSKAGKFLDYAGGYGIFTRLMRDVGFDYYWTDKYAKNLLSIGFEDKGNFRYENVTAFEVFEHMVEPHKELQLILEYSDNIIFSTVLLKGQYPDAKWWYYGFNHGQHVSLYTAEALSELAQAYNLNFYTNGHTFHMFTKKKISNFYFKTLVKLSKYGLANWVKLFLTSKTGTDSNYLKTL
jgi:hypothetical protein